MSTEQQQQNNNDCLEHLERTPENRVLKLRGYSVVVDRSAGFERATRVL